MRDGYDLGQGRAAVFSACAGLALVASLVAAGCAHREPRGRTESATAGPPTATTPAAPAVAPVAPVAGDHPVDGAAAAELVHELIHQAHPTADPARIAEVGVVEIRVPGLWERMRMQVFDVRDDLWNAQYIVRDGNAIQLGRSTGGPGVTSIHVCDLDGDGEPELAYSYAWGSGLSRTEIAVFSGPGLPDVGQPALVFPNRLLSLRKQDDRTVIVERGASVVGTLHVATDARGTRPVISYAADAPADAKAVAP